MLCNYLKELEKTFGEDAMPMMLLKTTTMVYPLLNNFGISLHAPIAVIVDKESGRRQVLEHLLGFEKDIANSLSACPKEIRKQIQNSKYGFSVFTYDEQRYTKANRYVADNLEMVRSLCARIGGDISEQRMAVVLFSPVVPIKYEDIFAGYIHIRNVLLLHGRDSANCPELLKNMINRVLDKEDEIKYEIEHFCPDEDDRFQVLWAAGTVLRVILKYENMGDKERERYGEMINSALDMMRSRWKDTSDPEEFVSDFISRLHAAKGELFSVQNRRQTGSKEIGSLDWMILYDRQYYYISKELLEKICEPITNGFGINYVKYQLFEGGLLVGKADSSTYETKQIWVYDEHGKEIRKRCYKLCREKIDQEEDLTL